MGSDVAEVLLGDHCSKIGSGATPRGGSSVYLDDGEVSLIRSQNIYNDGFKDSGLVYITEEAAGKLRNVIVEEDDILLNITGDSVARVCQVDHRFLPARVNQHVAIIRPKLEFFDPRFLRYQLVSPTIQSLLLNLASAGATRNALTKNMIETLKVSIPPLSEQKAIAHILGSLDDKIELNRQMNETLEAMAQALFKSWFVDFDPVIDNALAAGNDIPDVFAERAALRAAQQQQSNTQSATNANSETQALFPDAFEYTEEMGWIPLGWSVSTVGSIIERQRVRLKFNKKNVKGSGVNPIFDQGSGLILGYHNGKADIYSCEKKPSFIFGDHTCITHLSTKPFSVGPNVIPLNAKLYDSYWVFHAIKDVQKFEEYRRHWMEFKIKQVLIPSSDLTSAFGEIVSSNYICIDSRDIEKNNLAKLRDTLLPKLLSGELRILNAEKLVAEGGA